ncbi:hypothetical protein CBR_g40626 [Chara braunii]|uniref:Reverse transcriptase/retrotransposon-derived protein RNase H-like domain-containing protein n=1 Tax=Chara braunii TaxID=69332 RepID=A0A388LU21_CHABU|nr:hypothetical protein CBR_g40626 [Chara braunii]|eukprot:GBG85816.1 hypothetical protein CBR_g40626 [Chara braunii]
MTILTPSQTAAMDQKTGETDEAYEARLAAIMAETKQRADAAAAARKKKEAEAERLRLLAEEQRQKHAAAAAKAADEERIRRRKIIFKEENALHAQAKDWQREAENADPVDVGSRVSQLLNRVTDLLATCIAQQEDIYSLDHANKALQQSSDQMLKRIQQLEQQVANANASAGPSDLADRVNVLEIEVGTLKAGAQQHVCAAASSSTTPRETIVKFDGLPIFCDASKTEPIQWWRHFDLKLDLHHVANENRHAYLYSRSGGASDSPPMDLSSDPGVVRLLDEFADVFESPTGVVPDRPISHEIILEDGVVPPKGCIYRMSEEELTVLRAQLDDLLDKGWIQPSRSPYGAPVLFVRKKNKALRLCIDYRKLNAQTVKNAGPLSRIDDLLERLGRAKFFSKLDLKSRYHQISVRPQDRYKTAFKTRPWRNILTIFDECWRHSGAPSSKPTATSASSCVKSWNTWGPFVTPQGISPLSDKIQVVQDWPEPRNVTDVRSFLGLTGYYQRFIKGYSKIAAHLTKLQCEDRPFDFGTDARESFLALKAALLSAEVLRIYDPLLPTRVTTDASGYGIGVVLEQHDSVDWPPVEYFSKKVSVVHSIDNAGKKELLAFVHALKRWRHFLLGRRQFRWVTENNPLVFYKSQDTVNSTIARWMAFIDQFDFFPDHIMGKSNRFADALSRRPDHSTEVYSTFEIEDDLRDSFIRGYRADPKFRDKYENCSSPNPAPSHYRIQEGYLLLHSRGKDLLCVPQDSYLCTRLLGEFHDAPATGHFGVNRTIGRLRERFWWPGLLDDVTRYCESCEVCRRCKPRNHRLYGELRP